MKNMNKIKTKGKPYTCTCTGKYRRVIEVVEDTLCPKCKGMTYRTETKWQGFTIDVYKCRNCGEEYFDPIKAGEILDGLESKKKDKGDRGG